MIKIIKLDYTLETVEERLALVNQILEEQPNPPKAYLTILSDYLILCMEKQERKTKKILTDNRLTTINKRETSFEGLAQQFEAGEDSIYPLINEDKNTIFKPKISITPWDIANIPFLAQIKEAIAYWERLRPTAQGKDKYIIKNAIIELQKDQYIIKNAYLKPVNTLKLNFSHPQIEFPCSEEIVDGEIQYKGISFMDPKVVSQILCTYSKLKASAAEDQKSELWCLMQDFDNLAGDALADQPILDKITEWKIDGLTNQTIRDELSKEFGRTYAPEYISTLWRKKIPNLISQKAQEQFLNQWYLNNEKGKYKKCNKCGQIKLAHPMFFSKNKASKDGLYSICKECRKVKK